MGLHLLESVPLLAGDPIHFFSVVAGVPFIFGCMLFEVQGTANLSRCGSFEALFAAHHALAVNGQSATADAPVYLFGIGVQHPVAVTFF